MDRNVGGRDRRLRILLGLVLFVMGYRRRETASGKLLALAGLDLLVTALVQRCPLNALLGIDTCPGRS